jgi:hypothetical protein
MIEEIDYSEEAKYDLFESVKKEKLSWASCIISKTAPSYEDINKKLEKIDLFITKKQYEKICKELGFSNF